MTSFFFQASVKRWPIFSSCRRLFLTCFRRSWCIQRYDPWSDALRASVVRKLQLMTVRCGAGVGFDETILLPHQPCFLQPQTTLLTLLGPVVAQVTRQIRVHGHLHRRMMML